ncbi:MAG: thiamine phosphate synthase, partial [Saprospiraceae bacterium]|nr:thiamine phosphate synthase [Pyrinomonadaceae bacterium]
MSGNRRPSADVLTYLITPGEAESSNFSAKKAEILETIRIAVDCTIKLFQIREKFLSAKLLFELTAEAAAITRGSETRLLVNDRADVALAANADGVHLPANSIPADVIRSSFPDLIIGVSTHSISEAESAAANGADFVTFGPVFETPDKDRPTGLGELIQVRERLGN